MKLDKICSAVVCSMKYSEPHFLVEDKGEGYVSVPRAELIVGQSEKETDRVVISGKISLAVSLDTVFNDGHFCMAFVKPEEKAEWDNEEMHLEWDEYRSIADRVADEADLELLRHAVSYVAVKYSLRNPVKEPGYIWYMDHAVDIHSHIVPKVDDGSQSIEESLDLLRLDREEGIQWAFATPHYGEENGYAPEKGQISAGFRYLCEEVLKSGSPIKTILGTEWYCSDHIVERIRNQEAFPMGNSDWYMVEFLEWGDQSEDAETMLRRLKMMKDNGIKTILAHPERYKAIQKDWDLAKRICDLGVRLQVNAYDLFLNPKDATRNLAQWMATEELISFIGSDMHGVGFKPDGKPKRRPQMKEGIRWLYENVNDEYANEIVRVNAERLLGVERLLD